LRARPAAGHHGVRAPARASNAADASADAMSLTFSSQAKPVATTIGAPLVVLAPGAAAVVGAMALLRRLRSAPPARRLAAAAAAAAGMMLGLAVVLVGPLPSHAGMEHIFVPRSWWDVGPFELLGLRIPQALRAATALVTTWPAAMPDATRAVLLALVAALAFMVAAAVGERRPARILADIAIGVALMVVVAVLGVYAIFALLWLVAYLNFWFFGLALVALQRWRHGAI